MSREGGGHAPRRSRFCALLDLTPMLSSDKNVEAIIRLFAEAKEYLELKGRDVQLTLTEKLAVGLSALILGAILLILGGFVLLFLAAMCAAFLADFVGVTAACAISALLLVLLGLLFYIRRTSWIVNPVTRFVASLILDVQTNGDDASTN